MRSPLIALLAIGLLAGCESDAQKLDRLKGKDTMAEVSEWYAQKMLDSVRSAGLSDSAIKPYQDSLSKYETEHQLTQRDLNKFMNGR